MQTRGILLAALLLLPATAAGSKHHEAPDLPLPAIRFSVLAPSPGGPWTLRLVNEGDRRLRVIADARLLELTVHPIEGAPVHCALPPPLRPEHVAYRAVFLEPAETYVDTFDPELYCFGPKPTAALAPDSLVEATYGTPRDPFIVADTTFPPEVRPLRELTAPPIVLGHRIDTPSALPIEPEKPLVDENAPRLAITSEPFVEASSPHTATVSVTFTNVGHRPGTTLLRPGMIGFEVQGPDGLVTCTPHPTTDAASRTDLATLAPGDSRTVHVRLRETCGGEALRRPGLYRLLPTFRPTGSRHARDLELPAAVTIRPKPTALRLLSGPLLYYATKPTIPPTHQPPQ